MGVLRWRNIRFFFEVFFASHHLGASVAHLYGTSNVPALHQYHTGARGHARTGSLWCMTSHLKIDFVSDVVCPWCAIGLASVQLALHQLEGSVSAELHFQPFELNPDMGPEGQDIGEHLLQKYGSTPAQMQAAREGIRARGASLGVVFNMQARDRIYNTFDAHRLLHWAAQEDPTGARELALKQALLKAYFADGQNPSDPQFLAQLAGSVGLDAAQAQAVLASDQYAQAVRTQEQFYLRQGIHSVPAVIINDRHLISGGQPPEVFAQAFRQIATEAA